MRYTIQLKLLNITFSNLLQNIFLNNTDTSELNVTENSRNILLAKLSVEDTESDQRHTYTFSRESSFLMISGDELWVSTPWVQINCNL